ncbi:MAG: hypothetical protein AMK73_08805 [Planctomycetes bacterium SM23_32]|nr:MAG: hypothetical protein AMK73_08805 [Planctomycetes bacterium SM23_32]
MHFERYGRTYQLHIRTADDLAQVLGLDDALWMATSAPISGLNCDAEFLALVDLDHNGRIRADEMRTAIAWLLAGLADRSRLAEGTDELALSAIDDSRLASQRLRETAEYILRTIGSASEGSISVAQIEGFREGLDSCPINGDGVITPDAPGDEDTQRFIWDVMSCFEAQEDLTGRAGITQETLDRFLAAAAAHLAWRARTELPPGADVSDLMPLGERTPAAYRALQAVRQKVEGFYARCRVVRFNARAAERIGIGAHEVHQADLSNPAAIDAALARAPLAEPNADGILPLDDSVNPVFRDAVREFRTAAAEPMLGREVPTLSRQEWERVKSTLTPYGDWLAAKEGGEVERLGADRLRECLEGPYARAVRGMLAADREVAERLGQARELKKLLLYHQHLLRLANNFVSFPELYAPARRAMFEMGALVIDGRWFEFAVKVEDRQRHAELARTSGMFVIYAELTRVDEADKMTVAAPVTSGTKGNLCVGKRGIFYDTHGRHYDARVVEVIENPVSFREALVSPFVRLGRFVAGKIEAVSGSAEKQVEAQLGKVTQGVQAGIQEAVQRAPAAGEQAAQESAAAAASRASASRRDLLIGASVSVAALSSAFAFVTSALSDLTPLDVLYGLLIIAVVVCVPTAIVAAFKLRRRDLSALLEGCGWAVNGRMRLDRVQRLQFTRRPTYPVGATGTPRKRWLEALVALLLLALIAAACALVALQAAAAF